ncbi:hypothetical protein TNCV_3196241 [Trichonephila clavipes]|nr:hypothetical protein TNCV_3196241 [Trichonephila clavipes]
MGLRTVFQSRYPEIDCHPLLVFILNSVASVVRLQRISNHTPALKRRSTSRRYRPPTTLFEEILPLTKAFSSHSPLQGGVSRQSLLKRRRLSQTVCKNNSNETTSLDAKNSPNAQTRKLKTSSLFLTFKKLNRPRQRRS